MNLNHGGTEAQMNSDFTTKARRREYHYLTADHEGPACQKNGEKNETCISQNLSDTHVSGIFRTVFMLCVLCG